MGGASAKSKIRTFQTTLLLTLMIFWIFLGLQAGPASDERLVADAGGLFWWLKYALFPFVMAWFVMARCEKHPLS